MRSSGSLIRIGTSAKALLVFGRDSYRDLDCDRVLRCLGDRVLVLDSVSVLVIGYLIESRLWRMPQHCDLFGRISLCLGVCRTSANASVVLKKMVSVAF